MATKSAKVTDRVQPEIKKQAEAVLERIGLPVSVLIDTLYRQIIMTGGIAYDKAVTDGLKEKAGFIAPVTVYPGEDELLALAQGAIRVMTGKETAMVY